MPETSNKRARSKAARQQQLIGATIDCIAERGLSSLTLAQVAQQAGVSIGLINLHFQSKERLLELTLQHLSDEYRDAWQAALLEAGDSPLAQLRALVNLDFSKPISDVNRIAVWFAFWGETKVRPTYRKLCAGRDLEYNQALHAICSTLLEHESISDTSADTVAQTLSALTDGLWLDLLMHPRRMTRKRAKSICESYLSQVIPQYHQE